jgi:uncharacterized protein (UPF0332 family)
MPSLAIADSVLLYVGTLTKVDLASIPNGRYPLPVSRMMLQVTSDRLSLAGEQLLSGDRLVLDNQFRSAISRHYYAMYHAARAIVFGDFGGDDFQRHSQLPRHLPPSMTNVLQRETELTDARLLRNQADYDPYPSPPKGWEADSRAIATIASGFVGACEDFALMNGLV